MLLHLLRRFIKAVLDPLVDDTKIAIDKERHQIGKIFVPGLPAGHNFIKAVWFRFIAVQNPPFVPHSAYQPVRSCIMEVNMVSCMG